jgi:hydrogenase maturation factor HypE
MATLLTFYMLSSEKKVGSWLSMKKTQTLRYSQVVVRSLVKEIVNWQPEYSRSGLNAGRPGLGFSERADTYLHKSTSHLGITSLPSMLYTFF